MSQTFTSWGGLQSWTNGDGATGSIDFDAAGQVIGLHAGGRAVTFELDGLGRVVAVTGSSGVFRRSAFREGILRKPETPGPIVPLEP